MKKWVLVLLGFVVFVFRTFGRYWSWSWARYRGRLPARRGVSDHQFTIRVTTKLEGYAVPSPVLVFDDVTLEGEISGEEACRLFGFLGIHEPPPNAIVCRGGMTCNIRGGVHGSFLSAVPGGGDGYAVRVVEHSHLRVHETTPTIAGTGPDGGELLIGEEVRP